MAVLYIYIKLLKITVTNYTVSSSGIHLWRWRIASLRSSGRGAGTLSGLQSWIQRCFWQKSCCWRWVDGKHSFGCCAERKEQGRISGLQLIERFERRCCERRRCCWRRVELRFPGCYPERKEEGRTFGLQRRSSERCCSTVVGCCQRMKLHGSFLENNIDEISYKITNKDICNKW